ncbi:MAG: hypothetical protein K0Q72_1059, partial [Armatimonadetes bacterium]|nr:hypothetical protein [Armatimonadota bacterium]
MSTRRAVIQGAAALATEALLPTIVAAAAEPNAAAAG